jgi:AcrR family transcriptional regulator
METSASSIREARRHATSLRISHCARVLADEHGIDGFTMDDLAAAAEVSRRTLFNYFPGKDAAVRGDKPPLAPDLIATFREGGPTGDLVDDLVALVDALLDDADIDRDELALIRRVMHDNPRLITLAKQDFDAFGEQIREAVEVREGAAYDDLRTRVLFRVFGALFDLALDHYLAHQDRELAELFDEAIGALRSAFA